MDPNGDPARDECLHMGLLSAGDRSAGQLEAGNGANHFIFFGRKGNFSSNRRDEQEEGMLALHLLQNCLV